MNPMSKFVKLKKIPVLGFTKWRKGYVSLFKRFIGEEQM
ncbi:hypothetical protein D068_cds35410 [Bacillus atrophaeus UCMB-5137]|nr:hypothetical protein D068_cds35410 [Bacillus atrophaeus UCMB-5137]